MRGSVRRAGAYLDVGPIHLVVTRLRWNGVAAAAASEHDGCRRQLEALNGSSRICQSQLGSRSLCLADSHPPSLGAGRRRLRPRRSVRRGCIGHRPLANRGPGALHGRRHGYPGAAGRYLPAERRLRRPAPERARPLDEGSTRPSRMRAMSWPGRSARTAALLRPRS